MYIILVTLTYNFFWYILHILIIAHVIGVAICNWTYCMYSFVDFSCPLYKNNVINDTYMILYIFIMIFWKKSVYMWWSYRDGTIFQSSCKNINLIHTSEVFNIVRHLVYECTCVTKCKFIWPNYISLKKVQTW